MNEFKTAQDVLPLWHAGSTYAGFNRRIYGSGYADAFKYQNERHDRDMYAGWSLADRMINEGKLFYVHNFHGLECAGYAFQYGGTWVCNTCGGSRLDREWWKIKVAPDGNAWCCVGNGFLNLQESDNYAFGDTREEAIENYGREMVKRTSAALNDERKS